MTEEQEKILKELSFRIERSKLELPYISIKDPNYQIILNQIAIMESQFMLLNNLR